MLKRILCTLGLAGLVLPGCFAQLSDGTKVGINTGTGLDAPRSGVFWTSPTAHSGVIGDFYIDSLWQTGHVKLAKPVAQIGGEASDTIAGIRIRYNVLNDELEVLAGQAKKDIRVIRGSQVKAFKSGPENTEFVNLAHYDSKGGAKGFGEVLASGKLTLVKGYKPRITKPNYNPGFNTGEKNTVVRIATDYYLLSNAGAQKVSLSKKSLLPLLSDKKAEVEQYLKEHNPDLKDETQAASLIRYYNAR